MIIYKIIWHINAFFKKIFLKLIYGKSIYFGKRNTFRKRFNLAIDKGGKVKIGDYCFFNNDCSINIQSNLEIGKDCIFGENVKIYDHNHVFKDSNQLIRNQGFKTAPIKIGNNCWICSNVIILKGVKIGDNCVIGAGCVIKENIDSDSIVKCKDNIELEVVKRVR